MKKGNVLMVLFVVALCVFGWFMAGSKLLKQSTQHSDYIEKADEWVERGLYQRAIANYKLALAEKEEEEIYLKINEAYKQRYQEEPDETVSEYMDFLEEAVDVYPANETFVDEFLEFCFKEDRYEECYNCILAAIENGYDTEEIRAKLRQARYAFELRGSEFSKLKQSGNEFYSAKRNEKWNVYSVKEGYLLTKEYDYVSCINEDGMVVVTGNDSRILDTTGMVYGIFKGKVTDAGLFSDNLVPACIDGVYSYYDDFADKQFGEYEMAGSFQNGKAAVKKDGKWMVIDTKGTVVSEEFDEIVLDDMGNYTTNNSMIAKVGGVYGLYDEEFQLKSEFQFSEVDILTKDEMIAVAQDGKWGFVKSDGNIFVEPAYEEARSFSNGLAAVKKDGKWGFIDEEGNLVIECQFSDAGYMSAEGICPVRIDMPEEKEDSQGEEDFETMEVWKLLELEIGIKN